MHYYLGIGSNLGDRETNLKQALTMLSQGVGQCVACSSVHYSAPQGFESDNAFANIVAVYQTERSPMDILAITQQIEREMGRMEKSINGVYKDRVIDIDILLVKDGERSLAYTTDELCIPHPRMQERAFVMIPLAEIEENGIHPSPKGI